MKAEELHVTIAQKVRGDSKYLVQLTSAGSLTPVQSGLSSAEIESSLAELVKNNDAYRDIRTIMSPRGKTYFYSELHMTETYARILARVGDADPCLTIAETVREESRVYPRPTNIELFKYGLFQIDRDALTDCVARTQELYPDIKALTNWKGSVYLYSDKYLTKEWADLLAKKIERPDS